MVEEFSQIDFDGDQVELTGRLELLKYLKEAFKDHLKDLDRKEENLKFELEGIKEEKKDVEIMISNISRYLRF